MRVAPSMGIRPVMAAAGLREAATLPSSAAVGGDVQLDGVGRAVDERLCDRAQFGVRPLNEIAEGLLAGGIEIEALLAEKRADGLAERVGEADDGLELRIGGDAGDDLADRDFGNAGDLRELRLIPPERVEPQANRRADIHRPTLA